VPELEQQPAAYADAETRGKLRLWKQALTRRYRTFDRAYQNHALLRPLIARMVKRGSAGRRRAFGRIVKALGPGVTLEGVRLDGKYPLAVWSILRPRTSVTVDAPVETGLMQDCVAVNYVLAGVLPPGMVGTAEGLWSLEIPDHALGRAIHRSGLLPDAIIAEAHHNLLRLRAAVIIPNNRIDRQRTFFVKAGAGGFKCHFIAVPDISLGGA
jgi:hypothetical protein